MKLTKSSLKEMIREVIKEEKQLNEGDFKDGVGTVSSITDILDAIFKVYKTTKNSKFKSLLQKASKTLDKARQIAKDDNYNETN